MSLRKYKTFFTISIAEAFAYRGKTVVWILSTFFWIGVFPFIWLTAYGEKESIAGISRIAMITYFFLVPLIETVSSSWIDSQMANDVKNGDISGTLLKPVNYIASLVVNERAWQLMRFVLVIILMAILYPFISHIVDVSFSAIDILLASITLMIGTILSLQIASLIGMVAFFTVNTNWVSNIWWMVRNIAAGYMAPLAFFPDWAERILIATPFPLFLQTPILTLQGTIERSALFDQWIIGCAWMAFLSAGLILIWHSGMKRLESVGR